MKDSFQQPEMAKESLEISHARLARILDIADDAIISLDDAQNITMFNQGAEKIFGYSAQEVLGQSLNLLLPQRYLQTHRQHLVEFAHSADVARKMGERREIFGQRKSGVEFPAEASISKLQMAGENIFTVILRDITDRKQMEVALRLAHDELELRVKQRTSELESANTQLQQEVAERKRAESRINAALAEKEVLLKEIHHRVKNNLQIISSLLNLQSGYLSDEGAINVFKDCRNRVEAMALIHEQLYRSSDQSGVDFPKYIQSIVNDLFLSFGIDRSTIGISFDMEPVFLNIDTAIPCSLIINELISNSLKHGFPGGRTGRIAIGIHSVSDHQYELLVSDDGVGLPANLDLSNTVSLGLRLVNALTSQLNGHIDFQSDAGTQVRITFNSVHYQERI